MKVLFVGLRGITSQIIEALNRNEQVTVLYRGKPAAIMQPVGDRTGKAIGSAKDHAAFGLWAKRGDIRRLKNSK